MSPREAFKIGFLTACGDLGLDGPGAVSLMNKAAGVLTKGASAFAETASSVAKPLGNLALAAGVTLPVMAGAGAGYLAHRAAVPDVDDEDIKSRELIEELRHYARRARELQQSRALRAGSMR